MPAGPASRTQRTDNGGMKAPPRLQSLVDEGLIDTVVRFHFRDDDTALDDDLMDTGEPLDRAYWWPSGQWEADHTIPIVEGGDLTPENLRTLCVGCHRGETAKLRRRMADRRREAAA